MSTYQDVATKYGITPEQVKELQWAMADTWSAISCEWYACFESEQEAYDTFSSAADMISEATIDADRIKVYGNRDLTWFYTLPTGVSRLKLAEAAWDAE
jgi:hypothetical protein